MSRKKYERLEGVSPRHNELHRLTFQTPYLIRNVSTAPTADQLDYFEMVYCTADDKLYTNVSGTIKKSGAFS